MKSYNSSQTFHPCSLFFRANALQTTRWTEAGPKLRPRAPRAAKACAALWRCRSARAASLAWDAEPELRQLLGDAGDQRKTWPRVFLSGGGPRGRYGPSFCWATQGLVEREIQVPSQQPSTYCSLPEFMNFSHFFGFGPF